MNCKMNFRRGFTLIELLVALSMWAAILPLAGGTIYLLLRAQSATADALVDGMTLSRFAHTFRADVHAARRAEKNGDRDRLGEQVVLELDAPRTVTYADDVGGLIVRTVRNGSVIERREEFRLIGSQTRFELSADGQTVAAVHLPRVLALSGPRPLGNSPSIRIETVVGRDRRMVRVAKPIAKDPPAPALPRKPDQRRKES
jgi:prepilin-type N-terminal cleavage/methylation domain-containing protein